MARVTQKKKHVTKCKVQINKIKYGMRYFGKLAENFCPTNFKDGVSGSIVLNVWLAQLSGVPILGLKHETFRLKVILLLYGIPTIILVTCFYMAFELYDLVLSWPSLDSMIQNGCISLTHLGGTYKILNTIFRRNNILKISEKLQWLTRTYVISPKQRETYLRNDRQNKVFLSSYASLVGFTGVLGIVFIYMNPENAEGEIFPYRVYLPQWLPRIVRMNYMAFSLFLFAVQIVAIDYLNITMINQIRFHLNTLSLRFEELILTDVEEESFSTRGTLNPNNVLRSIVDYHVDIKCLCDDIERLYRIPLLIQFATSLLIFALSGFQATVGQAAIDEKILIYFYCGCILCELFLYCWFGNEVFEQNKTLVITGYSCSWYQFDEHFKKSLSIFLMNSQEPIVFTAGGFMNLDLPSFAGILSKAYTYIAVLHQFAS